MSGGDHADAATVAAATDATLVSRAQGGDRSAFELLFQRHAHPAWRVAIAVGGGAAVAEQAVVEGFTTVFRQLAGGGASIGTPFRHLAVRATIDAAEAAVRSGIAPPADDDANELVTTFKHLPGQWRAVLWLGVVEGGSATQIATLLGRPSPATAGMLERAHVGLQQRFLRGGGVVGDPLLTDMAASLRPMVTPMPAAVATAAAAWWSAWYESAKAERRHGLAAILPLGPWGERAVAGAAAAVLTAGIAAAVALGGKEATTRAPSFAAPAGSGELAGGQTTGSGSTDGGTGAVPPAPSSVGPNRGGSGGPTTTSTTTPTSTTSTVAASARTVSPPNGSGGGGGTNAPQQTAPGPGAEVNVDAAGTPIVISVGDQTGVQIGAIVLGTPPAPSGGVSVEVNTGLLPPITIKLP